MRWQLSVFPSIVAVAALLAIPAKAQQPTPVAPATLVAAGKSARPTSGAIPSTLPNALVVRFPLNAEGTPGKPDSVTPVRLPGPVTNEASALAANRAAEATVRRDLTACRRAVQLAIANYQRVARHPDAIVIARLRYETIRNCQVPCAVKMQAAETNYRLTARSIDPVDLRRIRSLACSEFTEDENSWAYARNYGGMEIRGRSRAARFGDTGGHFGNSGGYFPSGNPGQHENFNVPMFSSGYNGWGGPFDPSGYSLNRYPYLYRYYGR